MKRCLLILLLGLGTVAVAQAPDESREFDYVRRYIRSSESLVPHNGFVPDATTATEIAFAVATPVYSRGVILDERPLRAELKDGKWIVIGTLPPGYLGGTVIVQIEQATGRILYLNHSM